MRVLFLCSLTLLFLAAPAFAFLAGGCGEGKCTDCHSLERSEAQRLVGEFGERIGKIELAEVPGLWLVEIVKDGKTIPVFIDFSKGYMITGDVVRLSDKENVTRQNFIERNPVNPKGIPLEDALLLGRADAPVKAIVFTDPECSFCLRFHGELRKIVESRSDVAFYIKMFPLKIHPSAYHKAKSIVCSKSMAMLEESLAGKAIPTLPCEAPAVDQTIAIAERLGINSTPTLILPDGRVMPGFRSAEKVIELLGLNKLAQGGR